MSLSTVVHYDRRTIVLHWLTAGMLITLWGLAQVIDFFPNDARVWPRSAHILLGVCLVAVYAMRVVWRSTSGASLPAADRGWMNAAAKFTHYALYALVAVTLLLGLSYEAVRADNILNLGRLPSIAPGDRALSRLFGGWHGTAANAVLILAGFHATAALFHQFVLKDNLLRRMMRT
jgi:cytochrome b561